jgi:choline transport protein
MSEEVQQAGTVIPKAMVTSYTINAITVIVSVITFFFCLTDMDAASNTATGYPFVQVFSDTIGSIGGAIALTSILMVALFFCQVNNMASTSRQVFAFARDGGLPFGKWLSKVRLRPLPSEARIKSANQYSDRYPHWLSS